MGLDLVPIAADWSDWVGVMVTTHFGLVLGLFLDHQGPIKDPFWPKMSLFEVLEVLGGPAGAIFGPNSLGLMWLGWTHGYHTL